MNDREREAIEEVADTLTVTMTEYRLTQLETKVDQGFKKIDDRFEKIDDRARTQMIATIGTLITALLGFFGIIVTLLMAKVHP